MDDQHLIREAIALAAESLRDGAGGPFGAVVAKDGHILGRGRNRVLGTGDPTAHAEMEAIRDAARALGTHDLAGSVLYASCKPCPMCRGAAQWARVARVVYAATSEDAAAVGFDDAAFHAGAGSPEERVPTALREEAVAVMRRWAADPRSRLY